MSLPSPDFSKTDLPPAVIQDSVTKRVLMVAFMNRQAFEMSLETQLVHFWSRSRGTLWKKGETSGNLLELVSLEIDCDSDAILIQAKPHGPTCHTGTTSCFDAHSGGAKS